MLKYKIFSKLPSPYTITDTQIKSAYRTLYDNLLELYNKNDFYQIDCLLDFFHSAVIVPKLLYTTLKDDPDSDVFLSNFANLLYKIATIYPVKHFKAQVTAALFLKKFLEAYKKFISYTLDWKPMYKIIKFFSTNKESAFISEYDPFSIDFNNPYSPKQFFFVFFFFMIL